MTFDELTAETETDLACLAKEAECVPRSHVWKQWREYSAHVRDTWLDIPGDIAAELGLSSPQEKLIGDYIGRKVKEFRAQERATLKAAFSFSPKKVRPKVRPLKRPRVEPWGSGHHKSSCRCRMPNDLD